MKARYALPAILLAAAATAGAQAVPAATGPGGPAASGTLSYDLRYTQTAQFYGGVQGNQQRAVASGEAAYASASEALPSALTYTGGDMWNITGNSGGSGVFQRLMVSQGVLRRAWTFHVSDNVSYMPQAPTTGFSGIPGVGGVTGGTTGTDQSVLTLNTRSVNNQVSSDYSHRLDYATSLGVNGSYGILRFPDNNGLELNSLMVGPQITRRLNALNSLMGQYTYSRFSYPGSTFVMETQSVMPSYQRIWSRQFKTSVAAGPEWVRSSASTVIPHSTHLSVNANATYSSRFTSAMLSYTQAATGGAGTSTMLGTYHDDLNAEISRQIGRSLNVSATGAYTRTQGLQKTGVVYGKYGGAAATRHLGRYIIVFANYTAIQQTSSAALPANAISGLSQIIGFGIGYSPREMRFKK